ncbi:hypothetical protein THASP1DRAFT_23153 [Thamnocephalis sphaerospora]|uniref:Wbp11/ELF5/Saf1 N-terminal domain-containing protein n=1 Tax=Thamnocephalis sphaerospora TaxID=78915 RepID=A0A4P9XTQ5_9FUNG|nr:hypothetical protein THASP1DRAFT_23153 [Thamnocephalis sphaerospora]|eukprot:RKP08941.1 hypothetical protein THASP1DRAFT_23153 [Thamnocephalis sphaerospora]
MAQISIASNVYNTLKANSMWSRLYHAIRFMHFIFPVKPAMFDEKPRRMGESKQVAIPPQIFNDTLKHLTWHPIKSGGSKGRRCSGDNSSGGIDPVERLIHNGSGGVRQNGSRNAAIGIVVHLVHVGGSRESGNGIPMVRWKATAVLKGKVDMANQKSLIAARPYQQRQDASADHPSHGAHMSRHTCSGALRPVGMMPSVFVFTYHCFDWLLAPHSFLPFANLTCTHSGIVIMGRGKASNPVEAHRRAMRKREVRKNKEERQKQREGKLATADLGQLRRDVERLSALEAGDRLDGFSRKRLEQSRARLRKATTVQKSAARQREQAQQTQTRLPENPKLSVYYHPTLNPYGVPPPGATYKEIALTPSMFTGESGVEDGDVSSASDSGSDSDDDALPKLPPGIPPPIDHDNDALSDEELPDLPPGTPPPLPNEDADGAEDGDEMPDLPPGTPPPLPDTDEQTPSYPQVRHIPVTMPPPFAGPPPPPPPPVFAGVAPPFAGPPHAFQHPPPHRFQGPPMQQAPHGGGHQRLPPAQRRPPQMDPLNPEEDFVPPPPPSLPTPIRPGAQGTAAPRPLQTPTPPARAAPPAVISAAPQLRDLRKEVTTLVPTAVRRKLGNNASRQAISTTEPDTAQTPSERGDTAVPMVKRMRINAAPDLDTSATASSSAYKPSISRLPAARPLPTASLAGAKETSKEKSTGKLQDEYSSFMKEMEGLL